MVAAVVALVSCSPPEAPTARRSAMNPSKAALITAKSFAKGDNTETVLAAMGEPDASREGDGGITVWNYQFSTVVFRRGNVSGWNDVSDNLRTSGAGESGENMVSMNRGSEPAGPHAIAVPSGIVGATASPGAPVISGVTSSSIQVVESYRRADGTAVPRHVRTTPDASRSNNFSTSGNINPWTRKRGYR